MIAVSEITKDLPPRRDDEPPTLRQEIADEILDHLHSSLRRELLVSGSDEASALGRVLDRFGDPGQVARRLWRQAMWSKIMNQRLIVGSTICSMFVSISLVAMTGWLVLQMQRQHREQQQFNLALLEQMAGLMRPATTPPTPRDPNRNNLQIRLTLENQDAPPAKGTQLFVGWLPGIGDDGGAVAIKRPVSIDARGFADCGYVKPGKYEARIVTPWNEQTEVVFTVDSGKDHVESIAIPDRMPPLAKVRFRVKGLPSHHDAPEKVLVIRFFPQDSRSVAGRIWSKGPAEIVGTSRPFLMAVPNAGVWIAEARQNQELTTDIMSGTEEIWPPRFVKSAVWAELDPAQEFELPANRYQTSFSLVQLRYKTDPIQSDWRSGIIADEMSTISLEDYEPVELVAKPGELNEWTISLPAEVAKRFAAEN